MLPTANAASCAGIEQAREGLLEVSGHLFPYLNLFNGAA